MTTAHRGSENRPVEEIYQKKTQLEHILLRPDTYIGSVEEVAQALWVHDGEKMVFKNVKFVPGLYKIFDEILVNAADNKVRDPSMNTLKVNIDKENGRITIYNNGRGIPIEIHKEEQVYVPELIFGHLLTSSNYNDNEKKVTGGRNGYGAKLCNIFSNEFIVETADSRSGKKFKQVFRNNMSSKSQPVISSSKDDFTQITFQPDLGKFGLSAIDDDFEALLRKRVYDMAGCCSGVKVYFNDDRIKIKSFKEYVELFVNSRAAPTPIIHEIVSDRWEICITTSEGQFNQVSFVNSICTYKGGTHVNYVTEPIVDKILEAVNKKNKAAPVKPFQVKSHLWIFINCLIENPTFDSQTKENMTLRASAFGSKCELSEDFMKKVIKSGVIESILEWAKLKQTQLLKKTDGAKSSRVSGIPKLDDANMAGTKDADKCVLILTEGDSAKALAVSGLSVVGRDYYGVFPLRGKLLNVREASHKQIMENAEISAIKKILGLQHGKDYETTKTLRYGHLMIMTDQDHDGSHIKGLIINFLDHFFPSLLKIPGFLLEFITPIVKATKGKQELSFFTIPEYEQWREQNEGGKGWTIKYYKGLGTSTAAEAKAYFSQLEQHRKAFKSCEQEGRDLIDLAFSKKKADDRKEWLRHFKPGTFMDYDVDNIDVSDFINHELILFSMADNVRSIPSAVDGFKPGHRKIMFSCFKRNLKSQIKVAQLSGYVAEHSAYHHGEQSLSQTIIGLAQNYCGSNNINLLMPCGQFGTRLQGGKDAASPRYVFTMLNPIARLIFHEADDHLLNYLDDDGQKIEPEWYVPILPMVLVNGSDGIGTGWSSSIPNYNPRDIVMNLKALMKDEPLVPMHPWFRGFKGTIEQIGTDKYKVTGIITKIDDSTIEITELPIRSWTQNYKEFLESLLENTEKQPAFIKDFKEYHTDASVHFVVKMTPENMAIAEKEGLEKKFKISTTIATSNMVCFDQENRIRKYASVEEILRDFYTLRAEYYNKRKTFLSDRLMHEFTKLDNKARFVLEIIEGKIRVNNRPKKDIVNDLVKGKYVPFPKTTKTAEPKVAGSLVDDDNASEDGSEPEGSSSNEKTGSVLVSDYDYLLSMPIWNLTMEKVKEILNEKQKKEHELQVLLARKPVELWESDLEAFLVEWDEELKRDTEAAAPVAKGKGQKRAPVKAPKSAPKTTSSFKAPSTAIAKFTAATAAAAAKSKPALPKKGKKASEEEDDDESDADEIVEKEQSNKAGDDDFVFDKPIAKPKAAAQEVHQLDSDSEEEKVVSKARPGKAPPVVRGAVMKPHRYVPDFGDDEDDIFEEPDDDDDDEYQESTPKSKKTVPKPASNPIVFKPLTKPTPDPVVAKPPPKPKAARKTTKVNSDDENDDEDEPKPKAKPARKATKVDSDDEDEPKPKPKAVRKTTKVDSEDDEDEPKPKAKATRKTTKVDSEDEDEPKPKAKAAPAKKRKVDSEDEEEAEPVSKPKPAPKKPATKRKIESDDEDAVQMVVPKPKAAPVKAASKRKAEPAKPAAKRKPQSDEDEEDEFAMSDDGEPVVSKVVSRPERGSRRAAAAKIAKYVDSSGGEGNDDDFDFE